MRFYSILKQKGQSIHFTRNSVRFSEQFMVGNIFIPRICEMNPGIRPIKYSVTHFKGLSWLRLNHQKLIDNLIIGLLEKDQKKKKLNRWENFLFLAQKKQKERNYLFLLLSYILYFRPISFISVFIRGPCRPNRVQSALEGSNPHIHNVSSESSRCYKRGFHKVSCNF